MIRKSTLIGIFCAAASLQYVRSSAATYVDNGTSLPYTLNTGDSLHIASGTYTGIIVAFATGAKISIAPGAVFEPSSMLFPNVRGTIYVGGTFKMNAQLRTNTGFRIYNYGIVWATSTTLMSGSDQLWTNYYGGIINFNGEVNITNNNAIVNHGTINAGANYTMTGTTSLDNKLFFNVTGNYLNSGGTVTNTGRFYVYGSATFNNGLAIIHNHCRMIVEGGITNTSGHLYNYSYMWATNARGLGNIVNSGSIWNSTIARMHAVNFNNTGTVTGAGYLYFHNYTTTTASGTTGVTGITSDTIRIYDRTRSNPLTIYDNQTGTVRPNVVYRVFTAPDSTRVYVPGCSVETFSQIPLAVNWDYFTVTLQDETPALNWSAASEKPVRFEIQRSYDGSNFSTIQHMEATTHFASYSHDDATVNMKSGMAYYRIMAVEINGTTNYSETRRVLFSPKSSATVQAAPNPFTSQVTVNYTSPTSGTISIRVFNLTGQQQLARMATVTTGYNGIVINEVAGLAKGMYLLQVSANGKVIATQKMIRQ